LDFFCLNIVFMLHFKKIGSLKCMVTRGKYQVIIIVYSKVTE